MEKWTILMTNIDKNDQNKFKTTKNDGLGASKLEKLAPGDLVQWESWSYTENDEIFETKNGLLLAILKERRFSGWQYMAKITAFGDGKEVILPLISIRKME